MKKKQIFVYLALLLLACEPLASPPKPAFYVPAWAEESAQEWMDEVGFDAPLIVSEAPLGPGVWIWESQKNQTVWYAYDFGRCGVREAEVHTQYLLWQALSISTGVPPQRVGTAFPPMDILPTRRLDEDQKRAIRLGWQDLERACSGEILF